MLSILVEGDLKAPFSIATTPRRREGHYSINGLLHFTLYLYLLMLSVKQDGFKYYFWAFGMIPPGIDHRSPGPLMNALTIKPIDFSPHISPNVNVIARLEFELRPAL